MYVDVYGNTKRLIFLGSLLLLLGHTVLSFSARGYQSTQLFVGCEVVLGLGMGKWWLFGQLSLLSLLSLLFSWALMNGVLGCFSALQHVMVQVLYKPHSGPCWPRQSHHDL